MAIRDLIPNVFKPHEIDDSELHKKVQAEMSKALEAQRRLLDQIGQSVSPSPLGNALSKLDSIQQQLKEESKKAEALKILQEKREQIEKLRRKEEAQAQAEILHWERREEELKNIRVDRTAPFIGMGDVMLMLKPKGGR